jgi:hypothetical protein
MKTLTSISKIPILTYSRSVEVELWKLGIEKWVNVDSKATGTKYISIMTTDVPVSYAQSHNTGPISRKEVLSNIVVQRMNQSIGHKSQCTSGWKL